MESIKILNNDLHEMKMFPSALQGIAGHPWITDLSRRWSVDGASRVLPVHIKCKRAVNPPILLLNRKSLLAMTYSPRGLPPKYHRR
jgi:hypothetical protein